MECGDERGKDEVASHFISEKAKVCFSKPTGIKEMRHDVKGACMLYSKISIYLNFSQKEKTVMEKIKVKKIIVAFLFTEKKMKE